jgi:hypothetical protein
LRFVIIREEFLKYCYVKNLFFSGVRSSVMVVHADVGLEYPVTSLPCALELIRYFRRCARLFA